MDVEEQVLCLGILVGWITTILSIALIGTLNGIDEIIIVIMIGTSAGVISGFYLIYVIISFFRTFKVVRRD